MIPAVLTPAFMVAPGGAQQAHWKAGHLAYVDLGAGLYGLAVLRRPTMAPAFWEVMDRATRRWTYTTVPLSGSVILGTAGGWSQPRVRLIDGRISVEP